jgi:hypothetical protein
MGWFSKDKSNATAQFDNELRDLLSRARLNKVPEAYILRQLRSYADSIQRIAKSDQEARNMRVTPVQYDGYGNRIAQ